SKSNLLIATARDVYIGHHRYQDVPLARLIARLMDGVQRRAGPRSSPGAADQLSPEVLSPFPEDEPIRVRHVIAVLNEFLEAHTDVPVVADTGDAMFASVDVRANEIVAPAFYATMGFSIPAALGVQIVSGRRPLVLVGDGAFQMTGP